MRECFTADLIVRLKDKHCKFVGDFTNEEGTEMMVWVYSKSFNGEPYFIIPFHGIRVSPKIYDDVWRRTEDL